MDYKTLKKHFNIDIKLVDKFLDKLMEINNVMNLTAITDKDEMIEKHIYDSLLVTKIYDFSNKKILDVGSGGGFPGIPLAIMYPNSQFVLIDSTQKKVNFLNNTIKLLNLKNVTAICGRVESLKDKESFDVIIARALSELRIYLELVSYLAKINGDIIALKGQAGEFELSESNNAIDKLKLKLVCKQITSLPCGAKRNNYVFSKLKETSKKYPRSYASIKRNPL